jgi:hypothetical protein
MLSMYVHNVQHKQMNNTILKSFIVTFAITLSALTSKAQLGYMYSQLDLGVAGTVNTVYGDAKIQQNKFSGDVSLSYNQTPFVNYVFDFQAGNLSGGNIKKDIYDNQFSNNYTAYIGRAQLQLGEITDYSQSAIANAFKNLYLSTGVGFIANNASAIHYVPQTSSYASTQNNSTEAFIPIRIGYEFKLFNAYDEPTVKFDLAYQTNYVLGDEIDALKEGKSNDIFTQFSLGVKFAIGTPTSYRKQISY